MITSSPITRAAFAVLLTVLLPILVEALQEPAAAPAPKVAAVKQRQMELKTQQAEKNEREGEAFLTENRTREGVVTLKSGLQYKILKAGDGKKPTTEDTVVCHYLGTLIDGTEFANSYANARPATFAVKKALKGWTEALQLMPVGSRWQLFIPPSLAHGERGIGSRVGPHATLILEVELISIKETSEKNARALERKHSREADLSVKPGAPVNDIGVEDAADKAAPASTDLTAIRVSFKLDPRLTQGLYMGERWVSPPKYDQAVAGKSMTIEARAHGVDGRGRLKNVVPEWIASDPEMITVSPSHGNAVKITVLRAGRTSLRVSSDGISRQMDVSAAYQADSMKVEIAQK